MDIKKIFSPKNLAIAGASIAAVSTIYYLTKKETKTEQKPTHVLSDQNFNDENIYSECTEAEARSK